MNEKPEEWDIGEFASYSLKKENGRFTITISGQIKYANLLAYKFDEIRITADELREWVEKENK